MTSLGRIESQIKDVELKNKDMEQEIHTLRERNKFLEEQGKRDDEKQENSDYKYSRDLFKRVDEEKLQEDKLREVQSRFKGKNGTTELKKWCQENEVVYKNKDNAMMAVIAIESQDE